jgi:hypothetical protein
MGPLSFTEQNMVLGKPENMSDEQCGVLPVYTDGVECVSKWKLTDAEINQVMEHGYIWVRLFSGMTQPPICLQAQETIFETVNGRPILMEPSITYED